jgi:hypothetical protein
MDRRESSLSITEHTYIIVKPDGFGIASSGYLLIVRVHDDYNVCPLTSRAI